MNSRSANLHTDIPPEYRDVVTALLQREPEHQIPDAVEDGAGDVPFSLGRFLRPYRWRILVGLAIVAGATVVGNISPLIFAKAIDDGIVAKDFNVLLMLAAVYFGALILRVALRSTSTLYIGVLGQELLYSLRIKAFSHLQRLSYEYHNAEKAGHTFAILTGDISYLSSLLQDGLIKFLVQALMLVVITSVLFYMNAALAALLLFTVVPSMMLTSVWFRKRSKAKFREVRARNASVIAHLRQSLYGIRQIRIFNRAAINTREHDVEVDKYRRANDDSARLTSAYSAVTDFIEICAQAIVIFVGYRLVMQQRLTIGEVVAFALFLNRFFAPLEQLALLIRDYQAARAALERISGLLDTKPSIVEASGAYVMPAVSGNVKFEQVSFGYDAGSRVIADLDLELRSGEKVAVVGQTGAGKSTLIKLLTRLLEPNSGTIRIDGHDIRAVTLDSLRSQIGVVQQEPFLFHGTLRDNIIFGSPNATEAHIASACRAACLTELIARLPQGLDSSVHQQGSSLSAGERQLVAISRLFLQDPRIILMDEATSNIDPRTEYAVEQALNNLMCDRTTLIVSHRLNGVERADRVIVLGAGRLLEAGTHAELLAKRGSYSVMVAQWQGDAAVSGASPSGLDSDAKQVTGRA